MVEMCLEPHRCGWSSFEAGSMLSGEAGKMGKLIKDHIQETRGGLELGNREPAAASRLSCFLTWPHLLHLS